MTSLRLVADDLTGALDTAAEFVGLCGPVPVYWSGAIPSCLPLSAALDSGTRERAQSEAVATSERLFRELASADLAYKKVDSLLRGHTMAELAACFRSGLWDHCIVAPAFPHQGRITSGEVQFRREGKDWVPVADLVALLAEAGISARRGSTNAVLPSGVTVFDAATYEDLRRIAEVGHAAVGRVLWCGSAGLAQALAHGTQPQASTALKRPVFGVFGSDQAVTASQLAACAPFWLRLPLGAADAVERIGARLDEAGIALASFELPPGLSRAEAAKRIESEIDLLTQSLPRPGTLIAAGGETLRALCTALRAIAIDAQGQVEPGLPRSSLRGGAWDGVEVISKSGAFGGPNLWRDLLEQNGLAVEGTKL